MANDREVLREIWDGKIPVCFTLNSEEICDLQGPDPFYLMVSRLSYFPLCTEKVRNNVCNIPYSNLLFYNFINFISEHRLNICILFLCLRYENTLFDMYKVIINKSMRCGWNLMECH